MLSGFIKRLSTKPNLYLETYRMNGNPAPTERLEGAPMFLGKNAEEITASVGSEIDVYIMPIGADGRIRRDVP